MWVRREVGKGVWAACAVLFGKRSVEGRRNWDASLSTDRYCGILIARRPGRESCSLVSKEVNVSIWSLHVERFGVMSHEIP